MNERSATISFAKYTDESGERALKDLHVSASHGLTIAEQAARLQQTGPNSIAGDVQGWWVILVRQFRSSFIFLLVFAAGLALVLGEAIDGAMIFLFVGINAALGFFQEFRSAQTIKLLQQYVVPKTKVRRDGQEAIVDSRTLVPGDIVLLAAGDRVPADVRILSATDLTVDESILTGESAPVKKQAAPLSERAVVIYKAMNIGFSGTTVVSGRADGVVVATGRQSVMGDVVRLTVETTHVSSFEKGIGKFSAFILRLILGTLVVVFVANLGLKGGHANLVELVIFSIALAVSVIPEALPVVTTFSLSHGARLLARNKVVVKRLSSIEDLGSVEVLCTDKTGTLTENRLTLAATTATDARPLLRAAALGSSALPEGAEPADAFDLAVWRALAESDRQQVRKIERVADMPFDPERRRNNVIIRESGAERMIVRGAPESVLPLCTLAPADAERLRSWIAEQGGQGRRVLAVASRVMTPADHDDIDRAEHGLTLDGIIAFADPLKPTTRSAVAAAKRLGVQLKILTGDSREVAGAVGREIGLITQPDDVITGEEFERLPALEQHQAVERHAVFARVSPEQKFKLIALLKQRFEVGFLGEGINDAPGLKNANVGLVVESAADIARDAADIILLQRSLNVVVDGIRIGREVFANTTKYIKATLSSNFGNFYAVAFASLLIDYLPLLPLQILLINLLSDFPMILVATDNVDPDDLSRPRHYDLKHIAFLATLLGLVSTFFDFVFFGLFASRGPSVLQTNWFIGSILTELVFLFSVRTRFPVWRARRPSTSLLVLTAAAFLATILIPYTSFGHLVFHFVSPTAGQLLLILGIVVVYFMVTESVKVLYYRFSEHRKAA